MGGSIEVCSWLQEKGAVYIMGVVVVVVVVVE